MPTKSFPGSFESLAEVSDFVARAAEDAGFDNSSIYAVRLAVDEAFTNIIEHGYGGEGVGEIECTCDETKDSLVIVMRDWAASFDPSSVPEPRTNVPLEDLPSGGLGVFFMRKMMDEVRFEKMSSNGNVLTMIKNKP
jgi:serine/threonine-protein kinase RsbW